MTKGRWPLVLAIYRQRNRSWWQSREPLAQDGFEMTANLLDSAQCDELCQLFRHYSAERSYDISQDAYFVARRDGGAGVDTRVGQLMNAQCLSPILSELWDSGRLEAYFSQRLNTTVRLRSITIQSDMPDEETKRPFHVDQLDPVTLKLFCYLTDVINLSNGPYTVVPGSHRHVLRKYVNTGANVLLRRRVTDMRLGYSKRKSTTIMGKKGTTFLSVQTAVHRGWPEHRTGQRIALICYLDFDVRRTNDFNLGRHLGAK